MRVLIPWRRRNGGLLEPLRNDMEELFTRFFEPGEEPGLPATWAPRVDVFEAEKEITVKIDLPGVDAKDVEISVVNDTLVLRGEKKEEKEETKRNFHRVERFVGTFYLDIPLPAGADPEKVTATSTKGVVTVTIPKKPEVVPRKIAVKPTE